MTKESEKNKDTFVLSILKVAIRIVLLFLQISYSLVLKIEMVLKYFLEKKSQKAATVPYYLCTLSVMALIEAI
jgi:hypothetical protein